ncbi:MAG: hypothetical protein ACI8WT_003654, partial [Clostridium sp.]
MGFKCDGRMLNNNSTFKNSFGGSMLDNFKVSDFRKIKYK